MCGLLLIFRIIFNIVNDLPNKIEAKNVDRALEFRRIGAGVTWRVVLQNP